jgi:cytochrome bd-type quinol oxidase subunit 2
MKILIVALLLLVICSLFSALYFMYRDKGNSRRMVTALTLRIALSVAIFLILIGSYYFGLIPHR